MYKLLIQIGNVLVTCFSDAKVSLLKLLIVRKQRIESIKLIH
ncbi:hypothetical protein EMIT036CA2_11255 [Chryseobacterium sp. IT-36CA2]